MSKRGLINFQRESCSRNGQPTWLLRTLDGKEVEAFTRFSEFAQRYAPRTTKRYLEVVGRFLDYLFEAGVFGDIPLTTRRINAVIDAYPLLLRDGSQLTARRVLQHASSDSDDRWLATTAEALGWPPLKAGSFSNTLAAINHFLSLSESLSKEELERASLLGIEHYGKPEGLIKALQGKVMVTSMEVHRMRQNSILGSVAKYADKGIRRPRRIRTSGAGGQEDVENKAFPLEHLPALIEAATSWRDKALWLLLAASGIRPSEGLNLLIEDVETDEQRVYVIDPNGRHFLPPEDVLEKPRFKGRAMASTYLFSPLRQEFFRALEQYLKFEYVPTAKPGGPRFLFQYVEARKRGQPLIGASDTALAMSFKKAVVAAGIPLPFDGEIYTPRSLRHLYGVYMLNDFPIDPRNGRFGLPITDVQMLMGHKRLSTTQKYARVKRERLMQRLHASDQELLHLSQEELGLLPSAIAEKLRYVN